jgi:hypothetical protein
MHLRRPDQLLIILLFLALFLGCQKKSQLSRLDEHPHDTVRLKLPPPPQPPTGVGIGNSIIAGHPWHLSGLEQLDINLPDSFGQICYNLPLLTNFKWFDRGWGGQTTGQIRARFLRDALADTSGHAETKAGFCDHRRGAE